jgi:hypothetical protein
MLIVPKMLPKFSVIPFFLFLLSGLPACQTENNPPVANEIPYPILRSTVAVSFAPDGRLWRLTPTSEAVFVDYSDDNGQTYRQAIQVNPESQKISAWPENPPAITVSQSGRITVLYYADEQQKSTSFFSYSDDGGKTSTSFFSYSDDGGKTFSQPALISDHADTAMHYMDKMLIDNKETVHLFWHDRRHELYDAQQGSGVLSLYYSVAKKQNASQFDNQFISSGICSCCRTATAFDPDNNPVVLVRIVFADGVRDHALLRMNADKQWLKAKRITHDNWKIEACPEHGPAVAIDKLHRSHLTWFTLGDTRRGIYYAQTDDYGQTVSNPLALGNINRLPSHPDVLSLKDRVILTWKEFDGETSSINIQESSDRGQSWSTATTILTSATENGHPKLLSNSHGIFLSWVSKDKGHQIIKL